MATSCTTRTRNRAVILAVALTVTVGLAAFPAPAAAQDQGAGDSQATTTAKSSDNDTRKNLEGYAYLGFGVDSFAVNDLKVYLNPDDSSSIQTRAIAGFNFDYRLIGERGDRNQVWLYGETLHGVRSTDIDCKENPQLPTCQEAGYTNSADPSSPFKYIVKNASSLEGFFGARWEFLQLHPDSDSSSSLYVNAQAGFLSVAGDDDDLIDMHHGGLGLTITNGTFQGSHVEVGYGKNDIFGDTADGRWIVDGLFAWRPEQLKDKGMSMFAQISVDTDLGMGPDSIQSFFGLDIDLRSFCLFCKPKAEEKKQGEGQNTDTGE